MIANDTARPGVGIGFLIAAKAVRKVVVSHIGTNPETQQQIIASELEAELCPQGTLPSASAQLDTGSAVC